jgi:ribosomal protein L37AE/L43A
MNPECVECGDEFNPRRFQLGYYICTECGEEAAQREILRKSKCSAPAYNKGAYMYVTSSQMAKDLGR